jgi:hypothetical protein
MIKIIFFTIALYILLLTNIASSQCSDAGVCTLGSIHKKDKAFENNKSNISFYYSYGNSGSDYKISYNTLKLTGSIYVADNTAIAFNFPYMIQNSTFFSDKSRKGFGDAILTVKQDLPISGSQVFSLQGGLKASTSKISEEDFRYTNGYGTNDILLSVNYFHSFISTGVAAQIPVNSYNDELYEFKRGPDLLLRLGYLRTINNLNFKLEVLGIKRLTKSEITYKSSATGNSSTVLNTPIEIADSDFLQINVGAGLMIDIDKNYSIDFGFAVPLLKRDENSDGTKRALTGQVGFIYKFNI